MRRRRLLPFLLAALAASTLEAPAARAEPPPTSPEERGETEAREHFGKGVELVETKAWAEALTEFAISRQLHPTWKATKNAAACLRELQRYDEALDLLEALLREFPALPAGARDEINLAAKQLEASVGVLLIEDREPGAAVVVDGRYRGELPVASTLRVVTGAHVVRISRDGFEPFEARVVVAAGQEVRLTERLRALTSSGRLVVAEEKGRALDVLVDGRVVGKAPWEGVLPAGDHVVALQGAGDLGTEPTVAHLDARQKVALLLAAEPLGASLRIEPSPASARITIDRAELAPGAWKGRLRAGPHRITIVAPGFVTDQREAILAEGEEQLLHVALARDALSSVWRSPTRITIELGASTFVAPSFGGELESGCAAGCSAGPALGIEATLRGGVELRSGVGVGLAAGLLAANQTTVGRATSLAPIGLAPTSGRVDDTRKLRGFLAGAWGAYTFGERRVLRLRLGGGALLGSLGDSRTGTFHPPGASSYAIGPVGDAPRVTFLYVESEVRVGLRVSRRVELTAALGALVLFDVSRPKWDAKHAVNAASDGAAFFAPETLVGSVVVAFTPGVGARYEF